MADSLVSTTIVERLKYVDICRKSWQKNKTRQQNMNRYDEEKGKTFMERKNDRYIKIEKREIAAYSCVALFKLQSNFEGLHYSGFSIKRFCYAA